MEKILISLPLHFDDLVKSKRKFLKEKVRNTKKEINLKIFGGYTVNELCDWIKIFGSQYNININTKISNWGPAYNNLRDTEQSDFLLILNSWYDLYKFGDLEKFTDDKNGIISCFKNFMENLEVEINTVFISTWDFPPFHINNSKDIHYLNNQLYELASIYKKIIILPLFQNSISSNVDWYNTRNWYSFGHIMDLNSFIYAGYQITNYLKHLIYSPKKVAIIDLDNTLWGGVIGDDGIENILIGQETPQGRIYSDIQSYFKMLKNRGVLLAVCSKNEHEIGINGFLHDQSILKIDDFSCLKINWSRKSDNIKEIAKELNLALDSFVFIDDNPTEREEVSLTLPEISVPNIGSNPENYLSILSNNDYFGININLTEEDISRNDMYKQETLREETKGNFLTNEEFQKSLNIKIRIFRPSEEKLDRVHQLTNKTNQFNFTTLRVTKSDLESYLTDINKDILAIEASDKFGGYGIISIIYLSFDNKIITIDNWLMSCRVFNKSIESAIIFTISEYFQNKKYNILRSKYIKTKKNLVIKNLLENLYFKYNKISKFWELKFDQNLHKKIVHQCGVKNEI